MTTNRWLIAHSKAEGESGAADEWLQSLRDATVAAGFDDIYTTGKDDFFRCKVDMGNRVWKEWPGTRATEKIGGRIDRFTGAIVPLVGDHQPIGRGTYDVLLSFLLEDKKVLMWSPVTGEYREVGAVVQMPEEERPADRIEQWQKYGYVVLVEAGND